MSQLSKKPYRSDENIIRVCNNSQSMRQAARTLDMTPSNLKKRAIPLNCYRPNMSGRGISKVKRINNPKRDLDEILEGEFEEIE